MVEERKSSLSPYPQESRFSVEKKKILRFYLIGESLKKKESVILTTLFSWKDVCVTFYVPNSICSFFPRTEDRIYTFKPKKHM